MNEMLDVTAKGDRAPRLTPAYPPFDPNWPSPLPDAELDTLTVEQMEASAAGSCILLERVIRRPAAKRTPDETPSRVTPYVRVLAGALILAVALAVNPPFAFGLVLGKIFWLIPPKIDQ